MPKNNQKRNRFISRRSVPVMVAVALFAVGLVSVPLVRADYYDEQIRALNSKNAQNRQALDDLSVQAASYQQQISRLQQRISTLQAQITANQNKQASLTHQIAEKQAEIDHQRVVLGQDLRAMYVDGQMSTIEMLATSKTLSAYVDKEAYRTAVQNNIQATLKQIAALQKQLQAQKAEVEALLVDQKAQQGDLQTARAEQTRLLSYNQSQQDAYNAKIHANASKIADLRAQQAAANARFLGAAGSGPACGGGYPGRWCEIPQDSVIDSWGMYNRECVSYTAFRVAASGRHMPYWGGIGNANQWDDNARRAGIPVDTNPRRGDVAISNAGYYGHAMYVESVNGDGTINVSQYNAALDGRFSYRYNLDPSGLYFIHF